MEITMKEHMIIPEVVADLVDSALWQKMSLLSLTEVDDSLRGKPGDTLKFPAFRYIGKAQQVDENGQVQAGLLSADTVSATVKKYAKAVRITDEARLSGFGDPVGEAAKQLALAIDHAVDDALYDSLKDAGYDRKTAISAISSEAVADALTLFGEDQGGEKVLLTDAEGFARLRLDPMYLRQGDMAQQQVFSGAVGEIWGCQIVISAKLKRDPVTQEKAHYILKPGALRLINKTGTQVEVDREPEYMRDTIYCSKHCASYLYDASRVIALTEYTGLEALGQESGAMTEPAGPGAFKIVMPLSLQAPRHTRWAYKLSDSADSEAVYGAEIAGASIWQGADEEIASQGMGYVQMYNRLGSEGERQRREGGLMIQYEDMPESLTRQLKAWRLARLPAL